MVARQILDLLVKVRILVGQHKTVIQYTVLRFYILRVKNRVKNISIYLLFSSQSATKNINKSVGSRAYFYIQIKYLSL